MSKEIPTDGYAIKRSAPRFAYALDVQWQPDAPGSRPAQGRTRDISVRGFYFYSAINQPVGARLTFSVPFDLDRKEQTPPVLKGVGRVVRCEDLGSSNCQGAFGIAVKIDEVTP